MKRKCEQMDVLWFGCMLFLIEVLFRWRMGFGLFSLTGLPLELITIVFFACLSLCLSRKFRLVFETLFCLVFGIYVFAQKLHYSYFSVFFSFSKLALASELGGVIDSVFAKISLKDFVFFVPCVLMAAVSFLLWKRKENRSVKRSLLGAVLTVLCLLFFVFEYKIVPTEENWLLDLRYNYENLSNKNKAVQDFGALSYARLDFVKNVKVWMKTGSEEELNEIQVFYEENTQEASVNEMTGIFEGMNLILIQAESFSEPALNETVMPTLYQMAQQGILFTNFYAPIYQSATADSEFISQTSLVPSVDSGPTAYTYQNNRFDGSLASMFSEAGYAASSYHSYYRLFYNRELLHEALGFSVFYDSELLGIEFPEGFQDGINWPSDEELMWRMMNTVESEPFYSFVITASGHMPYVSYRPEYEGDYWRLSQVMDLDEEMLSYFASQSLFDRSLQRLLTVLKERELLENTVIIVYGDHYPYGLSEESLKEYYTEDYTKYQVPMIIWSGNQEFNLELEKCCSTFDLLPTIANLFGLDASKTYHAGTDLFSDEGALVYFYDRSWLSDEVYYDSNEDALYELKDSSVDTDAQMKQVMELFEISQQMLELDYYGKKE